MKFSGDDQPLFSLPHLSPQVWILVWGRLLSQIGTGFTLYFLQIFFVNQVGLSATSVGFAIGSGSLSGVLGRVMGGSMTDSHAWGRRRTLLLSVLISAAGAGLIALSPDLTWLMGGNLLMGLGVGLYWPSMETLVADLSTGTERRDAYTFTRLADSAGLGGGIILGGSWIALTQAYRALFVIDALSFLIFFGIVLLGIQEVPRSRRPSRDAWQGWWVALGDRRLLTFVAVNILITLYLSQVHSTMPLYFKNFAQQGRGFSQVTITALFTWHLGLTVISQLPVAYRLRRWSAPHALMLSVGFWGLGFLAIALTGMSAARAMIWAIGGLGLLAIATVSYLPLASALVADLAPESVRGVYLSVNSLCWAVGYFIGPALGGIALDYPQPWVDYYWLGLTLSVGVACLILVHLHRLLLQTVAK